MLYPGRQVVSGYPLALCFKVSFIILRVFDSELGLLQVKREELISWDKQEISLGTNSFRPGSSFVGRLLDLVGPLFGLLDFGFGGEEIARIDPLGVFFESRLGGFAGVLRVEIRDSGLLHDL